MRSRLITSVISVHKASIAHTGNSRTLADSLLQIKNNQVMVVCRTPQHVLLFISMPIQVHGSFNLDFFYPYKATRTHMKGILGYSTIQHHEYLRVSEHDAKMLLKHHLKVTTGHLFVRDNLTVLKNV